MFTRRAKPRLVRCTICGAEFKAIRSDALTCSARCRKKAWLLKVSPKDQLRDAGPPVYRQTCEVCLKAFVSKRSDARTCSARCRKARSRSKIGHLDRLERLAKNYRETENRKKADTVERSFAEAFEKAFNRPRPRPRKRKRPDSFTREIKRERARLKHIDNILKAVTKEVKPSAQEVLARIRKELATLPHKRGDQPRNVNARKTNTSPRGIR
jgi:predicted nucleic acid-binding Zn ribbon protein